MVEFSRLSSFWAISAIVDRVSKAVMMVEGIVESDEVMDCAGEEKTVIFDEFSLVG